jgi:23S rRNA pseudouridine2457 synthase
MPRYIRFFKPFEVLCQFTDQTGRATLKDFIPIPNIYSAGRLDYLSEGLLILTDDGLLVRRITDPRFDHPKTYLVQVEGLLTDQALQTIRETILLPGLQTRLAQAEIIPEPDLPPRSKPVRPYHPKTWLKITLFEGKKHQIRRMTAAVGFPTLRLVRFAIGDITLDGLEPGAWKDLHQAELKSLFTGHKSRNQFQYK